jgi:hypothetical protein
MDRLHFYHSGSLIATGSTSSVLERAPASTGATESGVLAQPSDGNRKSLRRARGQSGSFA